MAPYTWIHNILRVQNEGTQICMSKKKYLKVAGKGAPLHVTPTGSLWRVGAGYYLLFSYKNYLVIKILIY
jgi:hypothetical protein